MPAHPGNGRVSDAHLQQPGANPGCLLQVDRFSGILDHPEESGWSRGAPPSFHTGRPGQGARTRPPPPVPAQNPSGLRSTADQGLQSGPALQPPRSPDRVSPFSDPPFPDHPSEAAGVPPGPRGQESVCSQP